MGRKGRGDRPLRSTCWRTVRGKWKRTRGEKSVTGKWMNEEVEELSRISEWMKR